MSNALISIKPKYVRMILCGEKSIEIRNRPVNLELDTRLWIYSTLPKGCLEAVASVQLIKLDSPIVIWKNHHNRIGTSRKTFLSYVNSSRQISAIFLKDIHRLMPTITLSDLRSEIQGFHPPQFLKRLEATSPFFELLKTRKVQFTDLSNLEIIREKRSSMESALDGGNISI
jgi:predicted transcriptional regulator